jgi:hypothetical protein
MRCSSVCLTHIHPSVSSTSVRPCCTSYVIFQVLYTLSLQASNVAATIISAQVVDRFIDKVGRSSYALNFVTWHISKSYVDPPHGLIWCDLPWHDKCGVDDQQTWVISLG